MGILRRLSTSQQRVVPGRGSRGRLNLAASLATDSRTVGYLVRHSLRSGRAALHVHPGSGMDWGYRQELELQENPCLSPDFYYKDIGHP